MTEDQLRSGEGGPIKSPVPLGFDDLAESLLEVAQQKKAARNELAAII